EQRAALAIVRSLGSADYACEVGSVSGRSLAGSSRYARGEVALPDSRRDPSGFVRQLAAYVGAHGIEVVLPVSESSMLALLAEREAVPAEIPFAGEAVFRSICDKPRVLEAASHLGIRVPKQRFLASPSDTAGALDTLPIVLKPHASVVTDSS